MDIVDFHAHILPRADHGSSSLSVSLEQLNFAMECGVSRIVATPHFYPHRDSVKQFLARRENCYAKLKETLSEAYPEIVLGAEVLICDNFENLPGLPDLCIGKSNTLLLELPFRDFMREYRYTVDALTERGYNVVLAHADRYEKDNIDLLVNAGAKIQLNADSLATFFKNKMLYKWMERGVVVALGSDIHGADKKAYKSFLIAKKKLGSYLDDLKRASDKLWETF